MRIAEDVVKDALTDALADHLLIYWTEVQQFLDRNPGRIEELCLRVGKKIAVRALFIDDPAGLENYIISHVLSIGDGTTAFKGCILGRPGWVFNTSNEERENECDNILAEFAAVIRGIVQRKCRPERPPDRGIFA